MKKLLSVLSIFVFVLSLPGCNEEDSGTNPVSDSGIDNALVGTWVSGTMSGGTFVPASVNADTVVVTATSFSDGFWEIPQSSSCEVIAQNGKIGQSCSGMSAEYFYDYLIEGSVLYLESNFMSEGTADGQVVKAESIVFQKL